METFRLPPLAPAVRCHPLQHTTACHPRNGSGAWDNPPTWAATGGDKLGFKKTRTFGGFFLEVKFHDCFVMSNELFHSKTVLNKTCLRRDCGWMLLSIKIRFVDCLWTINLSGFWLVKQHHHESSAQPFLLSFPWQTSTVQFLFANLLPEQCAFLNTYYANRNFCAISVL